MRDKLAKLIFDCWVDRTADADGCAPTAAQYADYLISHGVTFATDNNDDDKCDYCQEFSDPCGVPMIASEDSDPDRGIYLYNGFLCASGGESCEAKVNYCPMCGRKLSELPKEGE